MTIVNPPPEAPVAPPRSARRSVPPGYLAAGWAALYGVLALIWTATGRGYPFGVNDPNGDISLLRLIPVDVAAPLFAALLLATSVAALAMAGPHAVRPPGGARRLLLAYGWLAAAVLLLVVPDIRVLMILGYLPMLILGAPFGWPPVDYAQVFDWALANRVLAIVGGVLLVRTVLSWQLRTAGRCRSCGRGAAGGGWTSAVAAARWGRWAVRTAAVIPVLYAVTRLAWTAGIPLGIPRSFLREMQENGMVWAGFGLGVFAVLGAVLTTGLVRRWGEEFPRWMIGLAGRRVPIPLAVVPAGLVAISVTAGSLGLLCQPRFWELMGGLSVTTVPMAFWPLWGVALGAATLAYYLRRRGGCAVCGLSH
jgi:hypothetical protein